MARNPRDIVEFDDDGPDYSVLGRYVLWAGIAAVAVGLAALAAQTHSGTQRLAGISGHNAPAPAPQRTVSPAVAPRPTEPEPEARRLAETVRQLNADRDRLLARL